jgi:hypothetical protein
MTKHATTSFSTEIFAGAKDTRGQYLPTLWYRHTTPKNLDYLHAQLISKNTALATRPPLMCPPEGKRTQADEDMSDLYLPEMLQDDIACVSGAHLRHLVCRGGAKY